MAEQQNGRGALVASALAAILASTCCLGPLVLVALGVSGAWIGNLTVLEPWRPMLIGAALVALFFAGRRIFKQASSCKPGEVCATPQVRTAYKGLRRAQRLAALPGSCRHAGDIDLGLACPGAARLYHRYT
jgi:mercuric ion transport protein